MTEGIAFWSTTCQAEAIRNGEISSRDLLELLIARVETINPDLNAVITLDLEGARSLADEADVKLKNGDLVGPLHGIPITIKDALETEGLRSTGGATELHNNIPSKDAGVVAAVKEAGAIVFGKTNLPRWSGDIQAFNEMFGTTVNPWDGERVPGGSSGGAAAAVSAGLSSFEIGTDIGGSIRFPASFCGVFGHKPSWGVVPSTGYLDHETGGIIVHPKHAGDDAGGVSGQGIFHAFHQLLLAAPGKVAEFRVRGNSNNLCSQLGELGILRGQGGKLGRAHKGEIRRIKH